MSKINYFWKEPALIQRMLGFIPGTNEPDYSFRDETSENSTQKPLQHYVDKGLLTLEEKGRLEKNIPDHDCKAEECTTCLAYLGER